jgi:CheY-specific phosphatase CheX
MPDRDWNGLVAGAVNSVLETMFFAAPLGPAEPEAGDVERLAASVAFEGRPSGTLALCISVEAARQSAADFLGEDAASVSDAQSGEVVCELANMVCGSIVTPLEGGASFDLSAPRLIPAETVLAGAILDKAPADLRLACRSFQLENGILTVAVRVE